MQDLYHQPYDGTITVFNIAITRIRCYHDRDADMTAIDGTSAAACR